MNGEALFTQLVAIFHGSAMVALGKIKNPATDKIERNLDQHTKHGDGFKRICDYR